MNAFILALLLIGGDDFRWSVTESPSFSWAVTEGGDNASLSQDAAVSGTDAPTLRTAIRSYRDNGGVRYFVRGKSDWQHLIEDHGWNAEQIRGLGLDELQYLHGATHTGIIQPSQFVAANRNAAPFTPAAAADLPPGADTKPALTIRVAPFHCPPCNRLKTFDWSDFDVTWETGGRVERGFPEISWTDSRGVKRWKAGAYTPEQVMWSWKATQ